MVHLTRRYSAHGRSRPAGQACSRGKVRSGAISRILCSPGRNPRRGSHSSRPRIAARLKPPTRRLARAALCRRSRRRVCLFGVAPDGGCRVSRPRRLPGAYSSLWPCSSRHRARPLAVIPPCGVRTFLDAPARTATAHSASQRALCAGCGSGSCVTTPRTDCTAPAHSPLGACRALESSAANGSQQSIFHRLFDP